MSVSRSLVFVHCFFDIRESNFDLLMHNNAQKSIRIVVIGDRRTRFGSLPLARVGKTSIITTFISDNFPENVDPVLCEVVIPADCTTNGASLTIVDSSCRI